MKTILCSLSLFSASLFIAPNFTAKPLGPEALERYKQGLALYAKGQKLHDAGKYEEANATYGQAMDLFRDGPKPDMANCYNRLGNVYVAKEPRKALWYYSQALYIRRIDHGREHPAVATSLNNVGMACMKMEEYDHAIAYFEAAMNVFRKVIPPKDNRHIATNHNLIGSAYAAQNLHGKALLHHKEALRIYLKVYGEKHPNVARSKRELGFSHLAQGDKKTALTLLNEAKDLLIATEGAGYVETKELVEKIKGIH